MLFTHTIKETLCLCMLSFLHNNTCEMYDFWHLWAWAIYTYFHLFIFTNISCVLPDAPYMWNSYKDISLFVDRTNPISFFLSGAIFHCPSFVPQSFLITFHGSRKKKAKGRGQMKRNIYFFFHNCSLNKAGIDFLWALADFLLKTASWNFAQKYQESTAL